MKSINSFFYIYRYQIIIFFCFVGIFLIFGSTTYAATTYDPTTGAVRPTQETSGIFATVADFALKPIAWIVYGLCLGIGGLFSTFGGMLLDFSITTTVLQAGSWFAIGSETNATLGQAILEMWRVIRDIFNILFIFAFIYIGIKTILNADDSGAKRSLGLLIIAALLINFSLYFTQIVIDFSNIAAVQVYNQIVSGGVGVAGVDTPTLEAYQDGYLKLGAGSITGAFFNIAQISSLLGGEGVAGSITSMKIIVYAIFMLIFLIITGIVCAMGAMLLIKRFIALTIAMILSPLMFVGWILPSFMGYQEKWRKDFLANAFFAPAFLFMLYLSLVVLQRLNSIMNLQGAQYTSFLNGADMEGDGFTIVFFFCLAIGFLYASIKVGEKMGAAGASSALKSLDMMKNYASGAAQSFVYRNTAGRGLNQVVKQLDKLDKAAEGGSRGARFLRAVGVDESVRRSVEGASNKGIAGGRGRKEVKEDIKTASERTAQTNAAIDLKSKITAGTSGIPTNDQKIAMETALADASVKDLEKLAKTKEGFTLLQSIAGNLPEKKFESLMDSKELSPDQLAQLGAGRVASVKRNITAAGGTADLKDGIKKASAEELNALDFNELLTNAMYVQSSQLDKLESKWGDEKMRIFKKKREGDMLGLIATGPLGIQQLLATTKGEKEIAKLPTDLFKNIPGGAANLDNFIIHTTSTNTLSAGMLQNIASESSLTGADKKAMGNAIKDHYTAAAVALPADIDGFFRSGQGAVFN